MVLQDVAGAEHDLAAGAVDPRGLRVQPRRDVALLVPGVGVQVEPLHRRAPVDQPRDAHAVVEVVRLVGDDVDRGLRVAAAHVVGGRDAGDAVADHHDALDRAVVGELDARELRRLRLVGRQADGDRALHPRAARHARVRGESEAVERRALVVGDRGQVLHAVLDRDRVGAADAHPAARLDLEVVGLGDLEHRQAGLDDDALALGLELDLRLAGAQGALAGQRALARAGDLQRRRRLARLAVEDVLLGVGAQQPRRRDRDERGAQAPGRGVGRRPVAPRGVEVRRAVPVEDRERDRAVERRQLVRGALEERRQDQERAGADEHVHGDPPEDLPDRGRRVLGHVEERVDQAGERADEELAVARPVRVGVVEVGEVGGLRVEVVAVLHAADARLAVAVGDRHERRLAVDALDRQQRADGRAPAALALEHHAAGEARGHRADQQQRAPRARVVHPELAQGDEADEQAERDHVAVVAQPLGRGEALGDPEPAGHLVGGRQRAEVAPQPRRRHEQQRQQRDDDLPHDEQAGVGHRDQQQHDDERADQAADAQQLPGETGSRDGICV